MAEVKILYEDKDIIVVVKPAGMASQEERSADMDMVSWLKNYLVREKKVKGMPYIGVIHRLDKPVGGVMVYAKTQQAAGKLSEQGWWTPKLLAPKKPCLNIRLNGQNLTRVSSILW